MERMLRGLIGGGGEGGISADGRKTVSTERDREKETEEKGKVQNWIANKREPQSRD